jgi:hypothetical protein
LQFLPNDVKHLRTTNLISGAVHGLRVLLLPQYNSASSLPMA